VLAAGHFEAFRGVVVGVPCAKLAAMTTREKAQKLLDETPEDELDTFVEIMASRSKPNRTAERARDFLISVARGTSGLDLTSLRTVRDRAWR
jgi:hypothetical protein